MFAQPVTVSVKLPGKSPGGTVAVNIQLHELFAAIDPPTSQVVGLPSGTQPVAVTAPCTAAMLPYGASVKLVSVTAIVPLFFTLTL